MQLEITLKEYGEGIIKRASKTFDLETLDQSLHRMQTISDAIADLEKELETERER
jgi:hypothetical protein